MSMSACLTLSTRQLVQIGAVGKSLVYTNDAMF